MKNKPQKDIRDIQECLPREMGKKGANLKFAHNKTRCLIPPTLVITTNFFKKLLVLNKVNNPFKFDWDKFKIPKEELHLIIAEIKKSFGDNYVVVRSSATCEDNAALSFAGQYSTFLNLKTDKEISKALHLCYQSLFSDNARYYAKINGINLSKHSMAILVQPVIKVDRSGVTFTKNPVTNDKTECLIETAGGLGDGIVSGATKALLFKIKKGETKSKDPRYLKLALGLAEDLEKAFGKPQDIEWGIKDDKIYLFQSRPITTRPFSNKKGKQSVPKAYKKVGEGVTACQGIAKGKICHIRSVKDYEKIKSGDIVYFQSKMDIRIVPYFSKIKGIIGRGGVLSHFSVLAREFNIPCLVELDGLNDVKNGSSVYMNASKGELFVSAN